MRFTSHGMYWAAFAMVAICAVSAVVELVR